MEKKLLFVSTVHIAVELTEYPVTKEAASQAVYEALTKHLEAPGIIYNWDYAKTDSEEDSKPIEYFLTQEDLDNDLPFTGMRIKFLQK